MQRSVRDEDITWRRVDDEVVVLDLRSSRYLSLNGSAALLWEALAEGASDAALTQTLVDTYGIDRARAETDAAAFLEDCAQRDLLR